MKAGAMPRCYSPTFHSKGMPLDRFFVRKVITDVSDPSIARTIVALAQSESLTATAEGVAQPLDSVTFFPGRAGLTIRGTCLAGRTQWKYGG